MPRAAALLPQVEMAVDAYALADGADALVVCTEWNEFRHLDLEQVRRRMRRPILVDGRNIYEPIHMAALGFDYRGFGRVLSRVDQPAVPASRA
jgi:UDPglucose 6-dehydrogenase